MSQDYRISQQLAQEYKRTQLEGGELLLNVVGSIGRSAVAPVELNGANVSRAIAVLPIKKSRVHWVQLFLSSPRGQEHMFAKKAGIAQPVLNLGHVKKIPIPLPSMDEQQRIVAEIEKQFTRLDAGVAALKRAQAELKRYRASLLKAACEGDWPRITVAEVAVDVRYGTSAKTKEAADGVPVLRMGNISTGRLVAARLKFLPKSHPEFPELLLKPGDLLFNRTNSAELVGKTAVYKGSPEPCSFASYLIRVRLSEDYSPEFLSYYLNSVFGRQWVASVASQQVGQANVNGTKLKALEIPSPPILEQQRIVAEVERRLSLLDKLEGLVERNSARATRLRSSVLSKVFG